MTKGSSGMVKHVLGLHYRSLKKVMLKIGFTIDVLVVTKRWFEIMKLVMELHYGSFKVVEFMMELLYGSPKGSEVCNFTTWTSTPL